VCVCVCVCVFVCVFVLCVCVCVCVRVCAWVWIGRLYEITVSRQLFWRRVRYRGHLPCAAEGGVCVMSHMRMSHVTHAHMNESCHTRTHTWSCHAYGLRINESCHTCDWVTSHIWVSHVTHMTRWRQLAMRCRGKDILYMKFVMSQIWISHVTCMNKWRHIHEWVMSHTWRDRGNLPCAAEGEISFIWNSSCHRYEWVM